MLRYNLMCSAGHGHYAPNQAAFVGKMCMYQNCKELLVKYVDPRLKSDVPIGAWRKVKTK